jgi:hypothetical protein
MRAYACYTHEGWIKLLAVLQHSLLAHAPDSADWLVATQSYARRAAFSSDDEEADLTRCIVL